MTEQTAPQAHHGAPAETAADAAQGTELTRYTSYTVFTRIGAPGVTKSATRWPRRSPAPSRPSRCSA